MVGQTENYKEQLESKECEISDLNALLALVEKELADKNRMLAEKEMALQNMKDELENKTKEVDALKTEIARREQMIVEFHVLRRLMQRIRVLLHKGAGTTVQENDQV